MTPDAGAAPANRRAPAAAVPPGRAPLPRRTLVAIFCVALAVRALVGWGARGRGEMEGLAYRYEESAYALAAGYGLVRPLATAPAEVDLVAVADSLARRGQHLTPANAPHLTSARWRPVTLHPPGYPLVLLAIYRVFGAPLSVWARVLQALADACACVLVAMIGRRLAGAGAGRIAGFGAAVFLPLAYLVTSRIADAWTPLLFALLFWLFLRGLERRDALSWVGAGVTAGALCLLRPDYALAPVFFAAAALLVPGRRRAVLAGAAITIATLALVLMPWALRNRRAIGSFTPGTTAAGMLLLQSVGQFPNPYGVQLDDAWYQAEAQRLGFESNDDPGAERVFRRRYVEILRRDPGVIARGIARRLVLGLVPPYHWGWDNRFYEGHSYYDYLAREHLGPLAMMGRHPLELLRAYWDRILFVPVSLVLLAAAIALLVGARDRRVAALIVLLPYAYVVAAHLPFYMTTRSMAPGVFAELIALGWCVERLRGRAAPLAVPGLIGDLRGA